MIRRWQVLDLFSGIGGFSLGLESTGYFETVAFCEIAEYPRRVLRKHWPEVSLYDDIQSLRGEDYLGVDLVCGGFPCQPVSLAGARKGKKDERWLWPEFNRVIREARPRWCLIENVIGLRTKHADEVLADLEEQGYTCWPLVVGAVHAGAPHRRQRVWIVAHSGSQRRQQIARSAYEDETQHEGRTEKLYHQSTSNGESRTIAHSDSRGCAGQGLPVQPGRQGEAGIDVAGNGWRGQFASEWDWSRTPEPVLRGVDDGLPCGVDRRERLKALGNSVVPQVVAAIGKAIFMAEVLS